MSTICEYCLNLEPKPLITPFQKNIPPLTQKAFNSECTSGDISNRGLAKVLAKYTALNSDLESGQKSQKCERLKRVQKVRNRQRGAKNP